MRATEPNDGERPISAADLAAVLQRLAVILDWSPVSMAAIVRAALAARDAAQRAEGDTNGPEVDR